MWYIASPVIIGLCYLWYTYLRDLAKAEKRVKVLRTKAEALREAKKEWPFSLIESIDVWATYQSLGEEFKNFPQLKDALLAEEAKVIAMGNLETRGDRKEIIHLSNCIHRRSTSPSMGRGYHDYHDYEDGEYRFPVLTMSCTNCEGIANLRLAVGELVSAENERERVIKEEAKRREVEEMESRASAYTGLADAMRAEANIFREVTEKVYGPESD